MVFLHKEDIEHMVQEVEKYKAKDKQRDKVSSKNLLESCAFNMKETVEDEKLQGKINDEDKQEILDKCNEITNWLAKNQTAEKEECEHQQKELEIVCNAPPPPPAPYYEAVSSTGGYARRIGWGLPWWWRCATRCCLPWVLIKEIWAWIEHCGTQNMEGPKL